MRKLLALLFGGVCVVLLLTTTLAMSLRSFVFDANFYLAALKAQGFFQQVEQDPLRVIDFTAQIPQLAAVPADLQQQVIAAILPTGWLEKQATQALQAGLDWLLSGEAGPPEIVVDLRQIKDRLQGPPGTQAAGDIVNAIPTCAPDQPPPALSFERLPECISSAFDRNYIIEQVATTLSETAGRLPAQYDLGPKLAPDLRFGLTFNGRRVGLAMLDTLLALLALGAGVTWIVGALIGGRDSRGRWTWLGGILMVGALSILAWGVSAYLFGPALLPARWFAASTADLSRVADGLAQSMLQQVAVRSIIVGGVLFIVAWGLLAWGTLHRSAR